MLAKLNNRTIEAILAQTRKLLPTYEDSELGRKKDVSQAVDMVYEKFNPKNGNSLWKNYLAAVMTKLRQEKKSEAEVKLSNQVADSLRVAVDARQDHLLGDNDAYLTESDLNSYRPKRI